MIKIHPRTTIKCLVNSHGQRVTNPKIMHKMAVEFYEQLLGAFNNSLSEDDVALVSQLFSNQISEQQKAAMQEDVSSVEIQRAIFNMNGDKSPGPDDFWTHFFKKLWSITQEDVINAVQYFFKSGKLLG